MNMQAIDLISLSHTTYIHFSSKGEILKGTSFLLLKGPFLFYFFVIFGI